MAIDPISLGLTGVGLVSNYFGGRAQQQMAREALAEQIRMFNQQMRFAKAARTDAFGNKVRFDDALNEWINELTPMQQRILKAGEHEQFLNLTEDAGAQRAGRQRAARRGVQAEEDFSRERARYLSREPPSEGSIRGELTDLIARARSGGDAGEGRRSIRQRGNMPVITPARSGGNAVSDLARTMLEARSGALTESGQRQGQHQARSFNAMNQFRGTADALPSAPINFSTTPQSLNDIQSKMAELIGATGQAGAKNIGEAYKTSTGVAGAHLPKIGDMARLIASLRGVGRTGTTRDALTRGDGTATVARPSVNVPDDDTFYRDLFSGMSSW